MSDTLELFGAPPGPVSWVTLYVSPPEGEARGRVAIQAKGRNRNTLMTLSLDNVQADRMATAAGYMAPLVLKATWLSASAFRAHCWSVYRKVSIAGWEATIKGCGRG